MGTEEGKLIRALAITCRRASRSIGFRRGVVVMTSLMKRTNGAVAIEFALVLIPFLGLTFAIIETCAMVFTDAVIQGAVTAAARQIRTGQVQAPPGTPQTQVTSLLQAFTQQVCNQSFGQIDCSKLSVDVHTFPTFASINLPPPFDAQGKPDTTFNTGGPNQVVTVRVAYPWNTITPGLSNLLGAGASQTYTMQYTVVLQNEPFPS